MLFNSYTFILFFAAVLVLHYAPLPWGLKKFNLLWASYIFYAAWNPPFVVLLWISTLVDWLAARWMGRLRDQRKRRLLLILSLSTNLGLLGYFKYGQFLLDNFQTLLATFGLTYHPLDADIILPVGISFYTFQTMSYTIDVYRRQITPVRSLMDFALYVTFFPQLVAGPIVRATTFLPQLDAPKRATGAAFTWGLTLLALGLFEKRFLADGICAPVAQVIFSGVEPPTAVDAWAGTLAFTNQILFDFAGYSTCAIGVAMCLGFELTRNFHFPYAAIGFSDFWRRWHISLSTWLRDYLYIPLGGNRIGGVRTYLNLMITMLLGGLWHGASWTFVAWGLVHGLLLCAERIVREVMPTHRKMRLMNNGGILALLTFVCICFTWVLFRAQTFEFAWEMVLAMLGIVDVGARRVLSYAQITTIVALTASVLMVHWLLRGKSLEQVFRGTPWWARACAMAVLLWLIAIMPGENRAFIYFQF